MAFWNKKIVEKTEEKHVAMSGQVVDIPNSSNLPEVQNWTDKKGLIKLGYGEDMMLPLLIEQSIYQSPSHKSCVKLKVSSAVGAGYEFTNFDATNTRENVQKINFESLNFKGGLKKFLQQITRDFVLHNRICLKINKKLNFMQYERVNPSMVGYNMDKTVFYFSRNFLSGKVEKEFKLYAGQEVGEYMMEYDGVADKYEPYAVPEWLSVYPNIKLNALIPVFHEANMENSVGISLVFRKPTPFSSNEKKEKYRRDIQRERGAKGTGNFIVLSGDGMENVTDVIQLHPNQNDKLFSELRSSSIDDICMGHNVNPVLIGVKTPGSLGASAEFDIAYNIFYNIEVVPIIEHIEEVINDIAKSMGMKFRVELTENKAFRDFSAKTESFTFKKE